MIIKLTDSIERTAIYVNMTYVSTMSTTDNNDTKIIMADRRKLLVLESPQTIMTMIDKKENMERHNND